jgi:hypothetical protein
MLNFPPAVRIWLGTAPVDLRRSFDGLAEQVRQHLNNDPLSGHIFVFRNKRGDRVKLLYWDEDGYVIVYKRLEAGVSLASHGGGPGQRDAARGGTGYAAGRHRLVQGPARPALSPTGDRNGDGLSGMGRLGMRAAGSACFLLARLRINTVCNTSL